MIGNKFIKVQPVSKTLKRGAPSLRLDFDPFTPWEDLTEEQRVRAIAYFLDLPPRPAHQDKNPNKFLHLEARHK